MLYACAARFNVTENLKIIKQGLKQLQPRTNGGRCHVELGGS